MVALAQAARREDWQGRYGARVAAVVASRAGAGGLAEAGRLGLATAVVEHKAFAAQADPRAAFDAALAEVIDRHAPALVLLAGFMRILTPGFVRHYEGRLINIHPSLLPAFAGLRTHERALEAGCRVAGATVHRVTTELDHGPILGQAVVPVLRGDTAERLAGRVLCQEHLLYPKVVAELLGAMTVVESAPQ
ncbi:MAG: phosphoribosylglycinamide formyltransferase [Rhodoferax sp.]|nr:phosphoribosylglycinamide formyltransferase [Rhodoferax sp.]